MNFSIRLLRRDALYVDAVQWQPGAATAYAPSARDAGSETDCTLLTTPARPAAKPVTRNNAQTRGVVPIWVHHRGDTRARAVPIRLGVPFPTGCWNGQGRVSLRTAANAALPVQTDILTQWHGDASLQALGVCFEADLEPGANRFDLHFEPGVEGCVTDLGATMLKRKSATQCVVELDQCQVEIDPTNGALWDRITDRAGTALFFEASICATGLAGTAYMARCTLRGSCAKWRAKARSTSPSPSGAC